MARRGDRAGETTQLPEPKADDSTWAKEGEGVADWLSRSTLPEAREVREFVNRQLAALPQALAQDLAPRLRAEWPAALLELVAARLMQQLGGELLPGRENAEGRRVDFHVRLGRVEAHVEVVAPLGGAADGADRSADERVIAVIARKLPADLSFFVRELPALSHNESLRELGRAIENCPEFYARSDRSDGFDVTLEIRQGPVRLWLTSRREAAYLGGPSCALYEDSVERIRRAVRRKRLQVRSEPGIRLVAVGAPPLVTSYEDFDRALFGHTVARLDENDREVSRRFEPDGVLSRARTGAPSLDGVVALPSPSPFYEREPVLYLHPRSRAPFPSELLQLETRRLVARRAIEQTKGTGSPFRRLWLPSGDEQG